MQGLVPETRDYGNVVNRFQKPSFKEQLQRKRDYLAEELAKVDAALATLDSDPKFAMAIESILGVNVNY